MIGTWLLGTFRLDKFYRFTFTGVLLYKYDIYKRIFFNHLYYICFVPWNFENTLKNNMVPILTEKSTPQISFLLKIHLDFDKAEKRYLLLENSQNKSYMSVR